MPHPCGSLSNGTETMVVAQPLATTYKSNTVPLQVSGQLTFNHIHPHPPHREISFNFAMTCDVAEPHPALPSPDPETEPETEADQEALVTSIQRMGIKIRDFAYEPSIMKTVEIFDPERAIGDHDFHLSKKPRTIAIPGKTLRRLLDTGWVGMKEAKERWHKMDWDALAAHDERPAYPWRPMNIPIPSMKKRRQLCKKREPHHTSLSRARREEEICQQLERQRQVAAQRLAFLPIDIEAGSSIASNEKKRPHSNDSTGDGDNAEGSTSMADSKRQRLLASLPTGISPPLKQFPAPQEAYDVEIYGLINGPDATSGSQENCVPSSTPPVSPVRQQQRTITRTRTFAYLFL